MKLRHTIILLGIFLYALWFCYIWGFFGFSQKIFQAPGLIWVAIHYAVVIVFLSACIVYSIDYVEKRFKN